MLGYRKIAEILGNVHETLETTIRKKDRLTRVGEHKFGIVFPDIEFPEIVMLAANKIRAGLDGLRGKSGLTTSIRVRTAAALYPDHGRAGESVLLKADAALKTDQEPDAGFIFDETNRFDDYKLSRLLESELETALKQSQFEIHYQPKVNLATRKLCGAEALLRWNHPRLGLVFPDAFIPLVESSPLLEEITLWILGAALNQSSTMRQRCPEFRIAVNISPGLLIRQGFHELVTRALRIWETRPDMLILEITETAMMSDRQATKENLRKLIEAGVPLSIDDFGTGYSSFSYLQRLPVKELKIDKSFVMNLACDESSEKIIKSVVHLAREFDIDVLAEGIETTEVLDKLLGMGCGYGQGYYIAKPMPASMMVDWMEVSGWV
jgi:EAL domain-containing protein (putative c-di-GMP-specific phosphodiesterase class I)